MTRKESIDFPPGLGEENAWGGNSEVLMIGKIYVFLFFRGVIYNAAFLNNT